MLTGSCYLTTPVKCCNTEAKWSMSLLARLCPVYLIQTQGVKRHSFSIRSQAMTASFSSSSTWIGMTLYRKLVPVGVALSESEYASSSEAAGKASSPEG